jgi:hypothetical protein
MDIFSIVLTVVMLAILGTLGVLIRDLKRGIEPAEVVQTPFDARMTALELQFASLKATVEENLERANRSWARARATESKIRRDRELEGIEEEPNPQHDLPLSDDTGGRGQGLSPVSPVLDESGEGLPPHISAARAYARSLIGA